MANQPKTKTGSPQCNYFTARATPQEVEMSFGIAERGSGSAQGGARQVQILHSVTLSVATARRVKDAMVKLLQKPETSRVRVKAQVAPAKKPH